MIVNLDDSPKILLTPNLPQNSVTSLLWAPNIILGNNFLL